MKKIVTGLCLAIALGATVTTGVLFAKASEGEAADPTLPESGFIGESYEIPEHIVEVNGEGHRAETRIIAPDGSVYEGTQLKPSMAGEYVVEYLVSGEVVKTETCLVMRRSSDFFSTNKFAQVQSGVSQYRYLDDPYFKGVKVNVQTGAEITFEREIDMTNKSKEDILFEAIIEPSERLEIDFGQMILKFTDVEDDTKTMTVVASDGHLDSATSGGIAYVRAGCNGQSIGGLEKQGNTYTFNTMDIYGAIAPFSFRAQTFEGETRYDYSLALCYDSEEKALYLKNGINEAYGQRYKIADFDDASIFGGAVWDGFTSGKAKLSVTFDKMRKESGSVIFRQIDGIDLAQEYLPDNEAPELSIDLNGEKSAPNSVIGNTYPLFNASAVDFYDGELAVKAEVKFQNLVTGELYDVSVQDGAFITDKVGKYVISYSAKDFSGRVAEKELSFYCYGEAGEISIKNTDEEKTVSALEKVEIVGVGGIQATGGNGKLQLGCTVYAPNGDEVPVRDNAFTPDMLGDYKIVYTAKDYFGVEARKEVLIHVQGTESAVFLSQPILPEVFISGFTYSLPEVQAKACDGSQVYDAVVETYVNGEKAEGKFIAPASGVAEIEYRAYLSGNTGRYESVQKSVAVIDGKGGADQTVYFHDATGKIAAELTDNEMKLKVSESGVVSFANQLNGERFEIVANYDATKVNFAAMRVVLSDTERAGVSVTFRLTFSANGVSVALPGASATPLGIKGNSFALKYDNAQCALSDINNGVNGFIRVDDNGNEFNGFFGAVFMKIYFDDVAAESEINIQSLNSQAFKLKKTEDDVKPQIAINGAYLYKHKVGDTLKIYTAKAYDVLNEIVSFTVSVTAPDGSVVLENASPDEEHSVVLSQRGVYKVVYVAKDSVGNEARGGATLEAGDATAPVLSVSGKIKTTYSVGGKVTLPKVTVSDDSGVAYCDIFVELPTGEVRLLVNYENEIKISYLSELDINYPNEFKVNENAFKAETAGEYVIRILAYDDAYNYVLQEYPFTVK